MDFTKLEKNLQNFRYKTKVCSSAEDAASYLESAIKGETIGFGGSLTIETLGLESRLAKNNTVIWHWNKPENRFRYPEFTAYLTSVNAIAETGEIINIDGGGNRISASIFGPKKIYYVVGRNKVAPDLPAAIERARQMASPPNNKRLGKPNPCVKDGKCHDCNAPTRICNVMAVHMRPMSSMEHTEVILIDADLGY